MLPIAVANILQHDVFPLARILQLVLKYGEQEMRRPVEIEFAATLSREQDKTGTFYLLQIRPIVDSKEMLDEDLTLIPDEDVVLRSNNSLGHGVMNEIYDIVSVNRGFLIACEDASMQVIKFICETKKERR